MDTGLASADAADACKLLLHHEGDVGACALLNPSAAPAALNESIPANKAKPLYIEWRPLNGPDAGCIPLHDVVLHCCSLMDLI